MSRVVTSADIDALNKIIQRQAVELTRAVERIARLETRVAELAQSFKALEENLVGPDPHVGVLQTPAQPETPLEEYERTLEAAADAAETFLSEGAPASDVGVSVGGE
jgi:hypothetical protein